MKSPLNVFLLNAAIVSSCASSITLMQCAIAPGIGGISPAFSAAAKKEEPKPRPHPADNHAAQERAHEQQAREQQAHQQQERAHEEQARQQQERAQQQEQRQAQQREMQSREREQAQEQKQEQKQESFRQEHPARAEVLGRDANLNRDLNEDKGDLSGHYGQLKSEDQRIRRQEQNDAAHDDGRITGKEYNQLNREENGLSRQINRDNRGSGDAQFQENHPLRSEVLGRDANLNNDLNQDKGDLSGHYGQLKSDDQRIRRQEQIDAMKNGGHLTGQEYKQLNREENGLSRQINNDRRPANPPPLKGQQAPPERATPAPVLQGNVSASQSAQAQQGYQNMQQNLYPVQQPPANYQQIATEQSAGYLNNSQATVGGQPININSGNTYINNVPQSNYPSWWGGGGAGFGGGGYAGFQPPGPGWGWSNGFVLGAMINAGIPWLRFGWPHYYGPPPSGFIHPPNYFPTPWIYNPMMNAWREAGQMGWSPVPPPPEYTMPITVQVIEPVGMGNQIVMYNAFYHPRFGRWGYRNRFGYFVWLNSPAPM